MDGVILGSGVLDDYGVLASGVIGGGGDSPQPPEGFETFLDELGVPFRDESGGYIYTPLPI